jgi:hypothetical protein
MGGVAAQRSARRYRRARRLRSQKRGVVAVIGTLLALLVFFALFGIFLTQYLPLWMTDNESAFTSGAATSFAQFKSDVDTQYVLGNPPVLGTPFTVSSAGVPLLAQATQGALTFLPQTCPAGFYASGHGASTGQPINPAYCVFENQTLSVGPGGVPHYSLSVATGILSMQLPNRYYTGEMFEYEADGVVQVQSGGYEIMAFAPPFNVTRAGGNTTVSTSFLQLYGNATTVISQGSEEVYSHLRLDQYLTSNGGATKQPFTYIYEIGTQFPCAWMRFFQSQMNVSGVPGAQYTLTATPSTYTCLNGAGVTTLLKLTLTSVNYVSLFYAGTQVSVGIGSS